MDVFIKNSKFQATINSKGAELVSMQNKLTSREYIWNGNPDFWGKHSPVLFPIVGTLKDNFYIYENKKYELSRHGFARDLEFEIIEKTENQVTFSLKATSINCLLDEFCKLEITSSATISPLFIIITRSHIASTSCNIWLLNNIVFVLPNSLITFRISSN